MLLDDYLCRFTAQGKIQTSPESILGGLSHVIGLIEDNQLESRGKESLCRRKVFNLFAHDVDSAVIRGIQLGEQDAKSQTLLSMSKDR